MDDAAINIKCERIFLGMGKLKNYMSREKCAFKSNNFIPPNMHINSFHSNM